MTDRHHLLECILWPNGDGTFRKIINTAKRLDELGIYKDFKMTIPIEHRTHSLMHKEFKEGTEYELIGKNTPGYGKGYRVSGDKSGRWKGDKVGPTGMYWRAKKLYNSGQMTEEEFQPYREAWNKYQRDYKRERRLKCQY